MKKRSLIFILCSLIVIMSALAIYLVLDMKNSGEVVTLSPTPIVTPSPTPEVVKDEKDEFIKEMIDNMSIDEKIGQLFYVRYDGTDDALDLGVGGIILFGRDFEDKTKEEVIALTSHLQEASKIKLFIGTDEEGGIVNRISINPNLRPEPFASAQDLYREGGMELVISDATEKAELLKELGLNMDFAPVADVSEDPNDYIYERTFGKDADSTADYVRTVVSVFKDDGIASCLKHFPGYGNNVDTHEEIGHDDRDVTGFYENDFIPFEAGIQEDVDFILVSHNIVQAFDDMPASLSKRVHELLRDELSYDGIIITDDLVMKGITDLYGAGQAAILALEAGNDMLLSTDYKTQISAIKEAYQKGEIDEEVIESSLYRIIERKIDLGLISID